MGRDRSHPIDPRTAEGLLRDGAHGHPVLTGLLAAAAAPPTDAELSGEQAAVLAFRRARLAEPAAPRHRSARAVWARLITVKVAAVAVAIAAAGVAVAAGTGVLPNPLRAPIPAPGPTRASNSASVAASTPGARPTPTATPGQPTPAELFGLCQAYLAHLAAKPTPGPKPAPNPSPPEPIAGLAALTQAAGGAEHITEFCTALTQAGPAAPSKDPGKAAGHPTGPPSPHPSGDPGHGPSRSPRP